MVIIPALILTTPKVEIPVVLTLNEVTEAIPPITLVAIPAVVAKATLKSLSTLLFKVNAVVANDAVDAVPVKLPKTVTATPADVLVIIPALILTTPKVEIPVVLTLNEVTEAIPPITLVAIPAVCAKATL